MQDERKYNEYYDAENDIPESSNPSSKKEEDPIEEPSDTSNVGSGGSSFKERAGEAAQAVGGAAGYAKEFVSGKVADIRESQRDRRIRKAEELKRETSSRKAELRLQEMEALIAASKRKGRKDSFDEGMSSLKNIKTLLIGKVDKEKMPLYVGKAPKSMYDTKSLQSLARPISDLRQVHERPEPLEFNTTELRKMNAQTKPVAFNTNELRKMNTPTSQLKTLNTPPSTLRQLATPSTSRKLAAPFSPRQKAPSLSPLKQFTLPNKGMAFKQMQPTRQATVPPIFAVSKQGLKLTDRRAQNNGNFYKRKLSSLKRTIR